MRKVPPELTDVNAFQVAACLDEYEESVRHLAVDRFDLEIYRRTLQQMERVCRHCASLPQLSVPWIALLIAHSGLIDLLWKSIQDPKYETGKLAHQAAEHRTAVRTLRQQCLALFSREQVC